MTTEDCLVPVERCWVRTVTVPARLGFVLERQRPNGRWNLQIQWGDEQTWEALDRVGCGFQIGWEVQDVPFAARGSLGRGRVEALRLLAGREQVLVQLAESGRSIWLPYENLVRIRTVEQRFIGAEARGNDHGERLRLRLFAHALDNWNELTGALDRLDVDPLPHQVQLVHRILTANHANWLIADDVGLGKTIEVGLLLHALRRRRRRLRVLIICPAGLVTQWQDEMRHKFDQLFQIYGRDFAIHQEQHWKLHEQVIASIDLAKRESHLDTLQGSGAWDLIVVDEAHKLTRDVDGSRSQRYRLIETLRTQADDLLLLTATPHQGKTERFIELLKLVRPDLGTELDFIEAQPHIVAEIVLRNRKTEVTDAEGRFIFKGQQTFRVPIPISPPIREFNRQLDDYLSRGYRVGRRDDARGRAIGFVMTTYRKLASSSIAAIERALQKRRGRLLGEASETGEEPEWDPAELFECGDHQDSLADRAGDLSVPAFFADELTLIDRLLVAARLAREHDPKLESLIQWVREITDKRKNLVVFTEYRATQAYLWAALKEGFADLPEPWLIHGGMSLEEKLRNIRGFNERGRVLISTEAGGEGINLHRQCHMLVNYDLPWNPSRLVQRIGRLYRYGQTETVIAINLHARDSFDNAALDLMYRRVEQMVQDLAPVSDDYHARLHAEILGEVLEQLDVAAILETARDHGLARTEQEIQRALERAREAQSLQAEILSHASGFDPEALEGTLGLSTNDVLTFVEGMLPFLRIELDQRQYGGRVLVLRLPDDLVGRFPEFRRAQVVRVTSDRALGSDLPDLCVLDFENAFFRHLIDVAKDWQFDGVFGVLAGDTSTAIAAVRLRWQDEQGEPQAAEFVPLFLDQSGRARTNAAKFRALLRCRAESLAPDGDLGGSRETQLQTLLAEAEALLKARTSRFKHPSDLVLLAAGDILGRRSSPNGATPLAP